MDFFNRCFGIGATVLDANVIRLESNIRNSLKNWRRKEAEKDTDSPSLGVASVNYSMPIAGCKREWTSSLIPWKEGDSQTGDSRGSPVVTQVKPPGIEVLEHEEEEVDEEEEEGNETELFSRKRSMSLRESSPTPTTSPTTTTTSKRFKHKDPRLDINFLLATPSEETRED